MSERSGFPSMTALLGLLAILGYQNRDKIAEILHGLTNKSGDKSGTGAITGGLGGLLSGLSVDKLLNGGLGELVDQFRNAGQKDTADSWVKEGPNRDVAPSDLEKALGPDVLKALSQATGLPEEELLARLARELPGAVDKYTPQGRIANA